MHPSQKIKKYAGLNELALRLFQQPEMTPAAAALIVSGVLPMPGCTEIPEQGVLLEDQVTPATSSEFWRAKKLLKEWVDSELSDEVRQAKEDLVGSRLAGSLGVTYATATWIMALTYALVFPS